MLQVVLQVPSPVNDLVQSQDKEHLFVACNCGVYCVNLQLLLSRYGFICCLIQCHSKVLEMFVGKLDPVRTLSHVFYLCSGQCAADGSLRPTELKISSKFLVFPEKGVFSLLLVGSELLAISRKSSHWMLTVYRTQKQGGTKSCEMLTSFSFPLASDNNEGRTAKKRPVLTCVHYGKKTPPVCSSPPETANNGHFYIHPVLFKLLFGIDAALAESPVVLCGLPDGCLYFLPLRLPGSRPRALYSLEQPVIFVGASSVDESGPEHAQCLVAIGEQGRVVLIRTRKGQLEEEANAACFLDRCLPGRLMCGCIVQNTLYYSVGSDFLKQDLSSGSYGEEGQNGKEEASRKTEALHQSPTSLNVCKIIAVAQLECNTAGKKII